MPWLPVRVTRQLKLKSTLLDCPVRVCGTESVMERAYYNQWGAQIHELNDCLFKWCTDGMMLLSIISSGTQSMHGIVQYGGYTVSTDIVVRECMEVESSGVEGGVK